MGDIVLRNGREYRNRWVEARLSGLVERFPVTVVTGARQVGKTTLLRTADPAARFRYLTLDDLSTSLQARSDPSALWAGASHVILDEVQRAPGLLSAVKAAVDAQPDRRFVLSGSANLLLMQQVTESLAGRAAYLVLRPLTVGEWEGRSAPLSLLEALLEGGEYAAAAARAVARQAPAAEPLKVMTRGLMPSLLAWGGESTHEWWDAYVAGYLERDLRQVADVSSLTDFRVVMQSMSLHAGRLFNQAEIGRDTGVTRSTLGRWVGLMEVGHVVTRLPAYAGARGARLVKMPKLHWLDPALAAFLGGHYSTESLAGSREFGGLFEGLVYHHLAVLAGLLSPPGRLYHWRDRAGREVDLVMEHGRRLLAVEVKSRASVDVRDASHLRGFQERYPECRMGVIFYGGDEVRVLGDNLLALPWWLLAGQAGC